MIYRNLESNPVEMLPGIIRRTLITTNKMMVCEFKFEAGSEIPIHAHPQEQVGYIVSGKVRMMIDQKEYELAAGDSYAAPSNVTHGALIIDNAVIIDTFSPPREDYR